MKTTVGFLAMILGIAGVILAIAAGILGWRFVSRVADRAENFTVTATNGLSQVENTLLRLQATIRVILSNVTEVRSAAQLIARGKTDQDPKLQAELKELVDQLTPRLEQSESLGTSLESLAVLLTNATELGEQVGRDPERVKLMREVANTLEKTAATLSTVRDNAAALTRGEAVPDADRLVKLAEQAEPPLNRLSNGLSEVQEQSTGVRADLADLQQEIQFWRMTGPILLSVFFLWFALGQVCLFAWGRRQFVG